MIPVLIDFQRLKRKCGLIELRHRPNGKKQKNIA
jgi:hypothetical protein